MKVKMKIHTDCKFYSGDKPCEFHKRDGRKCDGCDAYEKMGEKILIIKLDALGDVLRTTAILPALIKKYPRASITWITRRSAVPLLKNINHIDRLLAVEDNYLEFILNEKFDLGICLDADPLSASILSLARCDEKKGFVTNPFGKAIPANRAAETWWRMGVDDELKRKNNLTYQQIIYDICDLEPPIHKPLISETYLNPGFIHGSKLRSKLDRYEGKIVGINTGGGSRWQWKKWISDYYVELIRLLKHEYPDIPIILYGGPDEVEFNKKIVDKVGNKVLDAGCKNSLLDFVSLVSLSDIFFTPDSLGFHIATALDKTVVALVGPTSPWELEVYGKGEIIYPPMECIACYLKKCNKSANCMQSIKPLTVFNTIKKYLDK